MTPHGPYEPEMPPSPFVPPFDPPGSESPYIPEGNSTDDDGSSDGDGSGSDIGPRPPWWSDELPWPPEPEPPVIVESPPSPHIWPRLPPDHPYHLPPGYSYPDSLPPGHPGGAYPGMPDYPVVHPGSWGEDWYKYPGILDDWPPSYEEEVE